MVRAWQCAALAGLSLGGPLSAQRVGRAASADVLPLLHGSPPSIAIEPAVWGRATLRLALWTDRSNEFLSLINGSVNLQHRLTELATELRLYPLTIVTQNPQTPILPFVGAGAAVGEDRATGYSCTINRGLPGREFETTTTCTDAGGTKYRVIPSAQLGLRFLPGAVFLDVLAQARWGSIGTPDDVGPSSAWRFTGGFAVGFTW